MLQYIQIKLQYSTVQYSVSKLQYQCVSVYWCDNPNFTTLQIPTYVYSHCQRVNVTGCAFSQEAPSALWS